MSYVCPACGGAGVPYDGTDAACQVCLGRAYVMALKGQTCPVCGGRKKDFKCTTCDEKAELALPLPYTLPVREVDVSAVRRAFVLLQVGGDRLDESPNDFDVDPFALGVTLGLMKVSETRRDQFGWDPGEMLEQLQVGVLRLSESGIWHFPDPERPIAVQLLRHPAKEE